MHASTATPTTTAPLAPLYETTARPDGTHGLRFNLHPGQVRAWNSEHRIVLVLAGTQSGKTSFGPLWLWREIQLRGPGDYMVVAPSFSLLKKKALEEFKILFQELLGLGRYRTSDMMFEFSEEGSWATFGSHYNPQTDPRTRVMFGYAANPESLESATAKAVWCDEAGQKLFKLGSYEALMRRLSLAQGRMLITTTPYDLGWLKKKLWDPWLAKRRKGKLHDYIDVIRFESIMNPGFARSEFERARRDLPPWKFDLFYRALFTRPAGQIYDSFISQMEPSGHLVKPFDIPSHWPRFLGMDFGGSNTAGMLYAWSPELRRYYAYREYLAGDRSSSQHIRELLAPEGRLEAVARAAGGAPSENQWRRELTKAGLMLQEEFKLHRPTISSVEVGIDHVYSAHVNNEIYVFDSLTGYLGEKDSYSRELDDLGEPIHKIADKNKYHRLDAERYIISDLRHRAGQESGSNSHSFH